MFCHNCGKELPDGAKFCSVCGTPTAAPAQPEAAPIDLDAPVTQFMAPKEPQAPAEPQGEVEPQTPEEETPAAEVPQAPAEPQGEAEPQVPEEETPAAEVPQAPAEPQGEAESQTPAEPRPEVPVPAAEVPVPVSVGGAPEQPPAKRRGKAVFVALGVVAVAAVAALIWLIVGMVGGGGGGKSAYAYLTEDGELMYLADLKEKTQALELTDEADWSSAVYFSPDGKTVYFTDADSTLYQIPTAELKKGGRAERIARDVSTFTLLNDGRLVYWEYEDGDNKLSLYDGQESFRLVRDYYDCQFSDDQKTLYYTEQDEADGTFTLYKMAVTKDAKGEKLLKNAGWIYTEYDADVLVYSEDDGDGNTMTIYSCPPGGNKTKLAEDVYSISDVTVDGGKVSLYYWTEEVEERTLYDFVTDAKAEEDAATLEAGEPEYPSWWDSKYSLADIYISADGTPCFLAGDGTEYPIDVAELQRICEERGYYWSSNLYELVDLCYAMYANGDLDPFQESYDAAVEEYSAAYEKWYGAQSREGLRQELKESGYNRSSYSLYHYTEGGSGKAIATQVKNIYDPSAPGYGIFLYRKASLEGDKVADVADLSYYGDVYTFMNTGSSGDEVWYQNVGGVESEIDLNDFASVTQVLALSGKEAVLRVYDGDEEALLSYSIGKDTLTFNSTILEGDDFVIPYAGMAESGKLYVFTDVVEGSEDNGYRSMGDFCLYQDGKLETIAKDIYGAAILDESGTTYAVTDVDSRNDSTELAVLKDGKLSTVNDEISGTLVFLDKTQLLYVSDGDLMLWDGKEERRIARDVEFVWAASEEAYTGYDPTGMGV